MKQASSLWKSFSERSHSSTVTEVKVSRVKEPAAATSSSFHGHSLLCYLLQYLKTKIQEENKHMIPKVCLACKQSREREA